MNASLKPVQTPADAEQRARVDLAACYRLADRFGLNEGIDNHLTLLVPGYSDRFLLAPFGMHWSEVKASDFMVVDFNGDILRGQGVVEPTALYIHQPVHRLSPQGRCVLHTHMPYATALCMLQNPRLEMAVQSALGFYDDIAYDSTYNGLAHDVSEGERLARALGERSMLMMGNHGVLAVGKTIPLAFERLYFLERAAQAQVLALSTGRPLQLVPEATIKKTVAQLLASGAVGGRDRSELHFDALKRVLDRGNSDYAS
ncbi:MAG TPA: aldolase [Steroidobacteraceae bacterium]|jgi:ribulose-5-phosphate 4-epimerase/fuculose-1-phosphate aldolase|nr:aldolase [Steroidobacteraceae bacterium]